MSISTHVSNWVKQKLLPELREKKPTDLIAWSAGAIALLWGAISFLPGKAIEIYNYLQPSPSAICGVHPLKPSSGQLLDCISRLSPERKTEVSRLLIAHLQTDPEKKGGSNAALPQAADAIKALTSEEAIKIAGQKQVEEALQEIRSGRSEKAERILRQVILDKEKTAVQAEKGRAEAISELASLVAIRDTREAKVLMEGALRIDPQNRSYLLMHAEFAHASGDDTSARASLTTALTQARTQNDDAAIAATLVRFVNFELHGENTAERTAMINEAIDRSRKALQGNPTDSACLSCLSVSLSQIAELLLSQGQVDNVEKLFHESLSIDRSILYSSPEYQTYITNYISSNLKLSNFYFSENNIDDSLKYANLAEHVLVEKKEYITNEIELLTITSDIYHQLATINNYNKDFGKSIDLFTKLTPALQKKSGDNPSNKKILSKLCQTLKEITIIEIVTSNNDEPPISYQKFIKCANRYISFFDEKEISLKYNIIVSMGKRLVEQGKPATAQLILSSMLDNEKSDIADRKIMQEFSNGFYWRSRTYAENDQAKKIDDLRRGLFIRKSAMETMAFDQEDADMIAVFEAALVETN